MPAARSDVTVGGLSGAPFQCQALPALPHFYIARRDLITKIATSISNNYGETHG